MQHYQVSSAKYSVLKHATERMIHIECREANVEKPSIIGIP